MLVEMVLELTLFPLVDQLDPNQALILVAQLVVLVKDLVALGLVRVALQDQGLVLVRVAPD